MKNSGEARVRRPAIQARARRPVRREEYQPQLSALMFLYQPRA